MKREAVVLGVATAVGALCAGGLTSGMGSMRPDAVAAPALVGAPLPPSKRMDLGADALLEGIMGRNLFDVSLIGRAPAGGPEVVQALGVKLLGTVVADPEIYSSALVVVDGPAVGVSPGDHVAGRQVVSILQRKVVLRRDDDGRLEELSLTDAVSSSVEEGPVEGLGEDRYVIARADLTQALSDPASLQGLGRVLPHRGPDGQQDGYRLSGLRKGSMVDGLGLQNGDLIKAVDGTPMTSMGAAAGLLSGLGSAAEVCIDVDRRGATRELCYELR